MRFLHHVLTWVFLTFIPIHVYLGTARRRGTHRHHLLDHQRWPVHPQHEEFADDEQRAAPALWCWGSATCSWPMMESAGLRRAAE